MVQRPCAGYTYVCIVFLFVFFSQVNGHDMTVVTHKKAVDYIQRKPVLNMLVHRPGVPQLQKGAQPQFQAYEQQYSPQPQYQRQY